MPEDPDPPHGDEWLVKVLRERRPGAVGYVYNVHGPALIDYAKVLVGDQDLAVETVRDTLVGCGAEPGSVPEAERFRDWLYRLVRDECLSRGLFHSSAEPFGSPEALLRARVIFAEPATALAGAAPSPTTTVDDHAPSGTVASEAQGTGDSAGAETVQVDEPVTASGPPATPVVMEEADGPAEQPIESAARAALAVASAGPVESAGRVASAGSVPSDQRVPSDEGVRSVEAAAPRDGPAEAADVSAQGDGRRARMIGLAELIGYARARRGATGLVATGVVAAAALTSGLVIVSAPDDGPPPAGAAAAPRTPPPGTEPVPSKSPSPKPEKRKKTKRPAPRPAADVRGRLVVDDSDCRGLGAGALGRCTVRLTARSGKVRWSVDSVSGTGVHAEGGGRLSSGESTTVTVLVRPSVRCYAAGRGAGSVGFSPGGRATVTYTCWRP